MPRTRIPRLPTPEPRGGTGGQALVELALLLPVFLLLAMIAVDFGRLFTTFVAVNNAAREGAYYAAVHAADPAFDQVAFEAAVSAAALREHNVQGQGGEGGMTVSVPTCFVPATGVAIACDTAANFATGIGNQVSVSAKSAVHLSDAPCRRRSSAASSTSMRPPPLRS